MKHILSYQHKSEQNTLNSHYKETYLLNVFDKILSQSKDHIMSAWVKNFKGETQSPPHIVWIEKEIEQISPNSGRPFCFSKPHPDASSIGEGGKWVLSGFKIQIPPPSSLILFNIYLSKEFTTRGTSLMVGACYVLAVVAIKIMFRIWTVEVLQGKNAESSFSTYFNGLNIPFQNSLWILFACKNIFIPNPS